MSMLETFKLTAILIILLLCFGCEMKIRKPCCAGTWYSNDKKELAKEIDGYLKEADDYNLDVKAVVVPHAGIGYSGKIAALSFKQLHDFKKVIVLGTAHTYPLENASMTDVDYYATPLGNVKVCGNVKGKDILKKVDEAHVKEHSIEIELPFLQRVLNDFCIIPVIVGKVNTTAFTEFLEKNLDEETVIVVSVDLSHFHSYEEAKELDNYSISSILDMNSGNIKNSEIDSPYAVMSVIELAKKKGWSAKLLDYKNSGDITGDKSSVVGYSAIVFYEEYSESERKFMLNLAKSAVEEYVKTGKRITAKNVPEKLKEERACFVTLNENDNLRGCIGTLTPVGRLYESIIDNAISACSRDPRFTPVEEKELTKISYEVSILTEPKKISYKNESELFQKINGKGVILKKGVYEATYLPQVWEQFGSEQDFLSSLCEKAGLDSNEWKKKIEVYVYDAVKIS